MFAKLSALALVASPLVSALSLYPLTDATAGGTVTIRWTASTTDPTFSLELDNPENFHNTFAIANTVSPIAGELTITLPEMPAGDGYRLKAFAINDVNTVYSESTEFSVGAATSASGTGTSTDSTTSATSSTSSDSVTTGTLSVTTTTHTSSASTSAAKTSTSSSPSVSPSTLGGGAAPLRLGGVTPAVALLLSAVAGAAMIF